MNLYQLVQYLQRVEYGNTSLITHKVSKLSQSDQEVIELGTGGYEILTGDNDGQTIDLSATYYFCNLDYGISVSVNLPAPSSDNAGQIFTFLRTDGNGESQININATGNYGSYYGLTYPGQYVTFINDSNNWFPIYGSD